MPLTPEEPSQTAPPALPELPSARELQAFLQNPASYPHKPTRVWLIQTHASYVALVPPWVYKVKKSVKLGFLDYSTLERRRFFIERELQLNRPLAPGIYRRIVPIVRTAGGGLRFGGRGTPVEYALQMRYIPEEWVLRHRLQQGRKGVRPSEIRRIVRFIATKLYAGQHPSPDVLVWGTPERLRISTDENFEQTRPFLGLTLSPTAYELIQRYTEAMYEHGHALFTQRVTEHRILECHGDLHSEHIAYSGRRILIYDCIEFNERFRCIDVANDIAFLAMDLDYYGYPELGNLAVETLAAVLNDPKLPLLAEFYRCYRAYVRGKVESMRGTAPEVPESERELARERARRYFQLALRYATVGSSPLVLIIMGPIGSGKTTLAHALAQELGWSVLSSDTIRKTIAGLSAWEPSPEWMRPWLYSAEMTRRTYRQLWESAEELVRFQGGAIVDATFARRDLREPFRNWAQQRGIRLLFVELSAPTEVLRQRVRERLRKPTDSDAGIRELERLAPRYEPPEELPTEEHLLLQATAPTETLCRSVLTALMERHLTQLLASP